jgi:hypothetical protein
MSETQLISHPSAQKSENGGNAVKSAAPRIAAVVVTRNRLALLKECLTALRAQTHPPDEIFVINNDSDDGTREYLDAQSDLTVIHQGNLGGAGGFYRGIKESYSRGHDWFWCMDDDTIPALDALERLCAVPSFKDKSAGYLGSVVRWTDGALHKMNMMGGHDKGFDWYNTVLGDKCVPSSISTFVSVLINRRAVAKVGLPLKEFFIWSDDVEYTHRVSRLFPCFHVLDSVALHKTPANKDGGIAGLEPHEFWKLRYGLRNQVTFLRRQQGLSLRGLRVTYFIARNIFFIVRMRAPLSLIRDLLSGLLFNPRVEQVAPDKAL